MMLRCNSRRRGGGINVIIIVKTRLGPCPLAPFGLSDLMPRPSGRHDRPPDYFLLFLFSSSLSRPLFLIGIPIQRPSSIIPAPSSTQVGDS